MKEIRPATLAVLLIAVQAGDALALSCSETASRQQARYDATPKDCSKASMPAFLCSGVILRAAKSDQVNGAYDSWDVSKTSLKTQGTSFSYLQAVARTPGQRSVAVGRHGRGVGLVIGRQGRVEHPAAIPFALRAGKSVKAVDTGEAGLHHRCFERSGIHRRAQHEPGRADRRLVLRSLRIQLNDVAPVFIA